MAQGSGLGSLFFFIYINDLVHNISLEAKLFAEYTSLFTVVYDIDIAADELNRDLDITSNLAHWWKMQFNPNKNKQAIHVFFKEKMELSIFPCFSTGRTLLSKRSINTLI